VDFIDLKTQNKKIRIKLEKRFKSIMNSGKYILGPEVNELEQKLESYVGVKHCITCSSGTDALMIALMAKGIGSGDAIITSPFTYISTAEAIAMLGATPIFCDIYPKTYNLNPEKLQKAYDFAKNKGLKPKAIIPVNLFGLPARYRLIREFANLNNLFIIEDAAQSFGASISNKKACSFGDFSATSFFPTKPLGAYGDGGAIFTDNDEMAIKMRSIRVHGSGKDKYDNIRLGINGRFDTIQAAVILEKLKIFDIELINRNKIALTYNKELNQNIIKPFIPKGYNSSWALYSILSKDKLERDKLVSFLNSNQIPCMIYYKKALHLMKVFKYLNYKEGDFPISEDISNRIFSIPIHPYLNKKNQSYVIDKLNSFYNN